MVSPPPAVKAAWITSEGCESGKRAYTSRRAAKDALGATQSLGHMRPYVCPDCGYWHVGHLPKPVLTGTRTADEHYGRVPQEDPMPQSIDFINTTYGEVKSRLLGGQTPADVAALLQEPVGNIMGVWKDLRDSGQVEARSFPAPKPAAPSTTATVNPNASGPGSLIIRGKRADSKKIKTLAEKAEKAVGALADALLDYERQAEARAEVARLEAELAAAKARLSTPRPKTAKPPVAAVGDFACRKGCGRPNASAAGRAAHERHCTAAAA